MEVIAGRWHEVLQAPKRIVGLPRQLLPARPGRDQPRISLREPAQILPGILVIAATFSHHMIICLERILPDFQI